MVKKWMLDAGCWMLEFPASNIQHPASIAFKKMNLGLLTSEG
jgi:hypothetical protein